VRFDLTLENIDSNEGYVTEQPRILRLLLRYQVCFSPLSALLFYCRKSLHFISVLRRDRYTFPI
jgi:hypothetical protein